MRGPAEEVCGDEAISRFLFAAFFLPPLRGGRISQQFFFFAPASLTLAPAHFCRRRSGRRAYVSGIYPGGATGGGPSLKRGLPASASLDSALARVRIVAGLPSAAAWDEAEAGEDNALAERRQKIHWRTVAWLACAERSFTVAAAACPRGALAHPSRPLVPR